METELKLIESFERDTRWFHDNMKALRDRYKGNYVAICSKKNVDPSFVLIEFVAEKPLKMLFRRK